MDKKINAVRLLISNCKTLAVKLNHNISKTAFSLCRRPVK